MLVLPFRRPEGKPVRERSVQAEPKPDPFTAVPNAIWQDPRLKPTERCVVWALASYAFGGKPWVTASVESLARRAGCSERTAHYTLKRLASLGFVRSEPDSSPGNKTGRRLVLTWKAGVQDLHPAESAPEETKGLKTKKTNDIDVASASPSRKAERPKTATATLPATPPAISTPPGPPIPEGGAGGGCKRADVQSALAALRDDVSSRARGRAATALARSLGDEGGLAFHRATVNRIAEGELTVEAVLGAWDASRGDGIQRRGAAFNAAIKAAREEAEEARARAAEAERRAEAERAEAARRRAARDALPPDVEGALDGDERSLLGRLEAGRPIDLDTGGIDPCAANRLWMRHLVELVEYPNRRGRFLVLTEHGRAALERVNREVRAERDRRRREALLALGDGPKPRSFAKYGHAIEFHALVLDGLAEEVGNRYRLTDAGRVEAGRLAEPLAVAC